MHLYVEPLQKAKAIERLWVLYELATNFDSYGELSLGFSKKGHAELQGIARDLATEFESDVRGRDGAGLRAAKARRYPHPHRQHPPPHPETPSPPHAHQLPAPPAPAGPRCPTPNPNPNSNPNPNQALDA